MIIERSIILFYIKLGILIIFIKIIHNNIIVILYYEL